jgi:hypothetical protein
MNEEMDTNMDMDQEWDKNRDGHTEMDIYATKKVYIRYLITRHWG